MTESFYHLRMALDELLAKKDVSSNDIFDVIDSMGFVIVPESAQRGSQESQ